MSPVRITQTILHSDPGRVGNCYAACLASFLGCDLNAVPHVVEFGIHLSGQKDDKVGWWAMTVGFMFAKGYWPTRIETFDDAEPGELVFVGGPSPRGVPHQTLYRDGQLWHDPHPSRAGLVSIDMDDLIVWRPVTHYDHTPTATATDDPS